MSSLYTISNSTIMFKQQKGLSQRRPSSLMKGQLSNLRSSPVESGETLNGIILLTWSASEWATKDASVKVRISLGPR